MVKNNNQRNGWPLTLWLSQTDPTQVESQYSSKVNLNIFSHRRWWWCVIFLCLAAVWCQLWQLFGSQDTALDADQSNQSAKWWWWWLSLCSLHIWYMSSVFLLDTKILRPRWLLVKFVLLVFLSLVANSKMTEKFIMTIWHLLEAKLFWDFFGQKISRKKETVRENSFKEN